MKFIGIIPARYASTRFPAKPLAILGGKTVIQRVYEQVKDQLDDVYVATDDDRIESAVKAFGGKVIMRDILQEIVLLLWKSFLSEMREKRLKVSLRGKTPLQ